MKAYFVIFIGFLGLSAVAPALGDTDDDLYREIASSRYSVQIRMHWADSPRLGTEFRAKCESEIRARLARSTGAFWALSLVEDDSLQPVSESALQAISGPPVAAKSAYDKIMLATIRETEGTYRLAAREWDRTTQIWSATAKATITERSLISSTVHRLVADVFQPLHAISTIDRSDLELVTFGGEIVPPDADFSPFRENAIARPVIIYKNREQQIEKIQALPLTYIKIGEHDRAWTKASIISAYPAPLGGNRRSRVELWALGGRPILQQTNVKLTLWNEPLRVLMGHRIQVIPKWFVRDEAISEPGELLSDRQGLVTISPVSNIPVVWLNVWSGEALLARIPFVPGWTETEQLELPDDSIRLQVEGELDRLRGDLIADVARRAILQIRMLDAAKKGDKSEAYRLIDELRKLTTKAEYELRLQRIQAGGMNDSRKSGNRVSEMRIKSSCDRLKIVLNRYLDLDKEAQTIEEVDALLKIN
ncbi:MAG TPA: hypothetical protein VMM56_09695 [Planctomycetaceae bacterium]|nr:hypothetical protein [Planctomycetaceae bacterium]